MLVVDPRGERIFGYCGLSSMDTALASFVAILCWSFSLRSVVQHSVVQRHNSLITRHTFLLIDDIFMMYV